LQGGGSSWHLILQRKNLFPMRSPFRYSFYVSLSWISRAPKESSHARVALTVFYFFRGYQQPFRSWPFVFSRSGMLIGRSRSYLRRSFPCLSSQVLFSSLAWLLWSALHYFFSDMFAFPFLLNLFMFFFAYRLSLSEK